MWDDSVHAEFLRYYELLQRFSADYRNDSELKARIDGGDISPAVEVLGLEDVEREVQVRIVPDTHEVLHVIMPSDAERALPDSMLEMVAGGTSDPNFRLVVGPLGMMSLAPWSVAADATATSG